MVRGEIQESQGVSESTTCHSEALAEESTNHANRDISNFRPQYNKVLESYPHTSLESPADSEKPSGEVYPLRDKNEIARSADLEASSGRGDCQGGRERLRNLQVWISPAASSSPSPLDEKEKEILSTNRILKVKAKDSERLDSESKGRAESARTLDSEKQDLDSKNLEFTTDLESKKPASRDISNFCPQYDRVAESTPLCHCEQAIHRICSNGLPRFCSHKISQ